MAQHIFERVYEIVKEIPQGNVTTYGQIACLLGNPGLARVVGYALHAGKDPCNIPYHRVVNREGKLSDVFLTDGFHEQRFLLEEEGVPFKPNGHVDLKQCMWFGPEKDGIGERKKPENTL